MEVKKGHDCNKVESKRRVWRNMHFFCVRNKKVRVNERNTDTHVSNRLFATVAANV